MPADGANEREYSWEVSGADADALRGAMSHFPTGVTVVTSGQEENVEGMTANAVISVSLDPLLFLVSVHKDARINPRIKEEGYFAISLLADDQEGLSRLFASPERSSGLPALHSLGGGYGSTGAPLAAGRACGDRMRAGGHLRGRRPRPVPRQGRRGPSGRYAQGTPDLPRGRLPYLEIRPPVPKNPAPSSTPSGASTPA